MKKFALTSLVAVFAASSAMAANVSNPLYQPKAGHFYSETELASHSEYTENWGLGEKFGYGITNQLAVEVATTAHEEDSFDSYSWDDVSLGVRFRALDTRNWKADIYGRYNVEPVWGYKAPFMPKEYTQYLWTAGVRGGYVASNWTLAGHFDFNYLGDESFNWGDDGLHVLRVGVDGQIMLPESLNLVAGVEYTGITDDYDWVKNAGTWTGYVGVNYDIDDSMYVGAYLSGEAHHHTGDWEMADGFGFGVKFGIDF